MVPRPVPPCSAGNPSSTTGTPCTTPETRSGVTAGTDLAAFVEDLNARLGLPGSPRDMGVPASSIPETALKAERDHSTATNPRPTTAADYAALLEKSIAASAALGALHAPSGL